MDGLIGRWSGLISTVGGVFLRLTPMKELKVSVDLAKVKTAFRVKSTFDPSKG